MIKQLSSLFIRQDISIKLLDYIFNFIISINAYSFFSSFFFFFFKFNLILLFSGFSEVYGCIII